jgi:two-component system copper resistance phosphate regulon response regulator CusR
LRILIVEDDKKTVSYLKKGLSENGFVVDAALDGSDGLHMALSTPYDLIILDVMLPGADGWSILREIRKKKEIPALFLTAKDSIENRVKGLELGADDYLVKPFAFSELLARMRTILRRGPGRQPEILTVADLTVEAARNKAIRAGKALDLTQKEFLLLSLLARRKGEVLSRTIIAEQVWDIHFDSDSNVVEVAIRRLRAKVDDPFKRKLIHTVRGMGYVLDETRDQ